MLPFGLPVIDHHLPGGGLPLGAVHEVSDGDVGPSHIAAATLFVAGIVARASGPVLWCLRMPDLYAPALAQVGLEPDRVIYGEAPDERMLPLLIEEGLRHRSLAVVVGELSRLPMVASRRLQIAAEQSGVTAVLLRRRPQSATAEFSQPTASLTRWRVTALPSTSPLVTGPVPGIGRPRWRVELVRCRSGKVGEWELEGCDATGRLCLPAQMAHRPAARDGQAGTGPSYAERRVG
ncbi:damage-inducible protein [Azospirillum griseum]|uniref:ImuA family protein n=1 Tax=Azospirillum griseum TaxID=2496639 RepID=UPI00319DA08E